MLLLLFVLVVVAIAPSAMISIGEGDGFTVTLPTTAMGEAPLTLASTQRGVPPMPEAARRFAIARAQWQAAAVAGADRDDPEVLSGRDALETADHAQARLIADVAHTLGWLVEQAHAPR
jgi:hypothetical protein